jgi:hypothetical protein
MKKFLLSFQTFLAIVVFYYNSSAQINCTQVNNANNCNIAALDIKSAVTEFKEVGGMCEATITLSFKLLHNSGMKFANLFFYNAAVNLDCKNGPSSTVPSSIASLGGYIALQYTTNWVSYSSGINGLTPQAPGGYTVSATAVTGGTEFVITGIKFNSGLPCGSYDIGLYLAGTNASSNGVQCHNQSSFKPYLVSISGKIDCSSQINPLNYDLIIDANYQNPPGNVATIDGSYQVFIDANSNNIIDGPDMNLTPVAQVFSTSVSGAPVGYTRYTSFDNNINLANGDPLSSKNLLVRVTPSTLGVAAVTGQLTNTCATLPVSLKSFNATQKSNKAYLTWETDQENNNDGFEIERRSAGNSQYQKIGFVDSKAPGGTGNAYSYSFDDNQSLTKGVTYYRLRQVDLDGRATYSEVKAVRTGTGGLLTISIYPNPSRGVANVTIAENAGKMDVSLDDYTGKSVQRWSGISVRNLQINNMRPGIYMLRINFRETGETITERIIVQ